MSEGDSTAPLSFAGFLEKMKDPAAADLVRHIKGFIRPFETRSTSHIPDPEQDSSTVQTFFFQMDSFFRMHPIWKNSNQEILDQAVEGLEKYVMSKIWPRTFAVSREDKDRDERYLRLASALSFVDLSTLIGVDVIVEDSLLSMAEGELLKMDKYKAPRDKLLCLVNVKTLVEDIVAKAAQAGASIGGADAFFPVFLLVVIRARMPHLASTIEYIRRFRAKARLSGQFDFMLCNLESAAMYLDTVDWQHLKISREEFLVRLAEAGIPEADMALKTVTQVQSSSSPPSSSLLAVGEKEESNGGGSVVVEDLLTGNTTITTTNGDDNTMNSSSSNLIDGGDISNSNNNNTKENISLLDIDSTTSATDTTTTTTTAINTTNTNTTTPSLLLDMDAINTTTTTTTSTTTHATGAIASLTPLPGGVPSTPILLQRQQSKEEGTASSPMAKKSLIEEDDNDNNDNNGSDGGDGGDTSITKATSNNAIELEKSNERHDDDTNQSPAIIIQPSTTTTNTTTNNTNDVHDAIASMVEDGTHLVLEEESSGRLQQKYPWIYAAPEDLSVGDVSSLLASYREIVLKYEALSLSLQGQLGGQSNSSSRRSSSVSQSNGARLLHTLFGTPEQRARN